MAQFRTTSPLIMSDRKQPAAGKGDKPRTVNNKNWRDNYDSIDWGHKQKVPKNKFGIFAVHSVGKPITEKEVEAIINGPIAAMEEKYREELAKPIIVEAE